MQHTPGVGEGPLGPEVLPKAERQRRQQHPAASGPPVGHPSVVTPRVGKVRGFGHGSKNWIIAKITKTAHSASGRPRNFPAMHDTDGFPEMRGARRPRQTRNVPDEPAAGFVRDVRTRGREPPRPSAIRPATAGKAVPGTSAAARSGHRRSPRACRYGSGSRRSTKPPYRGRRRPSHAGPRSGWRPCGRRSSRP